MPLIDLLNTFGGWLGSYLWRLSIELAVLMEVMARMGCFGMSYPLIISFVMLGVGSAILLWFYFASAKGAVDADSKASEPVVVHSHWE